MHPHITASLLCAASVPFVYFGAQGLAAVFYPNFNVLRDVASALGSDVSKHPEIFNTGIAIAGLLATGGAVGLYKQLKETGIGTVLCLMTAFSLFSFAVGSFWAASHPLPDPRHDPGLLSAGMFISPFVAYLSARHMPGAQSVRIICAVLLFFFLAIASIYSGFIPLDRGAYEGALQRAGALTMLAPLSAISWWLFRRSRRVAPLLRPNTSLERTREG
jgi:glucans biosynthesis protein C